MGSLTPNLAAEQPSSGSVTPTAFTFPYRRSSPPGIKPQNRSCRVPLSHGRPRAGGGWPGAPGHRLSPPRDRAVPLPPQHPGTPGPALRL